MDLYVIVNEFETYYQMKFDKAPKLVKKLEGGEQSDKRLPKLNNNLGTPTGRDKPPSKGSQQASNRKSS